MPAEYFHFLSILLLMSECENFVQKCTTFHFSDKFEVKASGSKSDRIASVNRQYLLRERTRSGLKAARARGRKRAGQEVLLRKPKKQPCLPKRNTVNVSGESLKLLLI